MLGTEIWIWFSIAFNPNSCDQANICCAHEPLPDHINAMIFLSLSISDRLLGDEDAQLLTDVTSQPFFVVTKCMGKVIMLLVSSHTHQVLESALLETKLVSSEMKVGLTKQCS